MKKGLDNFFMIGKNFLTDFQIKEKRLLIFFLVIILIIVVRLFWLQIVKADFYDKLLHNQHYSKSSLKASRGNIYIQEGEDQKMQLTKNMNVYDIFVDPKFVKDKERVIELLSPLIYRHFCKVNGLKKVKDTKECIRHLEMFTNKKILTEEKEMFYLSGSQKVVEGETKDLKEENREIVNNFSSGDAIKHIKNRLDEKIKFGKTEFNYFGFFDNEKILNSLEKFDFVSMDGNYVYFVPEKVDDIEKSVRDLFGLFKENGFFFSTNKIREKLSESQIRYIKLVSGVNPRIAQKLKDMKKEHYSEKIEGIPLLHGVGLEKEEKRFYPHGAFLSHVLGYVNKKGKGMYGIEGFMDSQLKGEDGGIKGLSTPWIGTIGSKGIDIQNAVDGNDMYLTIDPSLQKEVERVSEYYYNDLRPDNVSVTILDPNNGEIKAISNYPEFDPNFYRDVYEVRPLTYEDRKIIDEKTYMDIPVLISSGGELRKATFEERDDLEKKKYIYKNLLGPQVFKDKNISFPYEPGSIFKAFTVAIGLDADEISLYDFYKDDMEVEIGPYTIANVHGECEGEHNFLHAFEWSCNVGMVKIVEKIGRYVFYNYLKKLGFGQKTGIELEFEDSGKINALEKFSRARFFNNAFGQGINVTPIQMAVGYAAMVNGGYLVQPTLIDKIYDKKNESFIENDKKIQDRIFKKSTSEKMKKALLNVMKNGGGQDLAISGYTLGGKTGTSSIAFKGEYQQGNGWTNGSFVGIVTKENPQYIIMVQVRRPRKCQWGSCSAGKIFRDISKYILEYKGIKK